MLILLVTPLSTSHTSGAGLFCAANSLETAMADDVKEPPYTLEGLKKALDAAIAADTLPGRLPGENLAALSTSLGSEIEKAKAPPEKASAKEKPAAKEKS